MARTLEEIDRELTAVWAELEVLKAREATCEPLLRRKILERIEAE
jgi:hypothetical protein